MILFLCEDIWSMGHNKGVSSLNRIIEVLKRENKIMLLTPEVGCRQLKNRYLEYVYNFLKYICINVSYICQALKMSDKPKMIYVSSPLATVAGKFLSVYYNVPYIQRLYGTFLYKKLGNRFEMLKSYQEVLAFWFEASKYIITDDGTYGDKVAKYFNIPQEKILFLVNGVDKVENIDRNGCRADLCSTYGISKDSFLIISVSRLVSWKRVDRIIKAMNILLQHKDIYYLLIGEGIEKEYYKRISLNDNVIFVGSKTNEELKRYYLAADVFVSMYDLSNLGNPLLEAMSAGIPIITLNNGDTKKVYDGENMILLKVKSDEEIERDLAHEICMLKENATMRKKLQNAAKRYANENLLSWEERIDIERRTIQYFIDNRKQK